MSLRQPVEIKPFKSMHSNGRETAIRRGKDDKDR